MGYLLFFFLLIIVVSIIIKWKQHFIIGWIGETFVAKKLSRLDPNHYKIINDLWLPSRGGSLGITQIDHIVVSNYGIFCIETKNHEGWIFGNANQEYWTQVVFYRKERIYNPLWQNYAHTKAIEELIVPHYPETRVVSLVAFPSADKLKISGTDMVGRARDIVRKIQGYITPVFSNLERDRIYQMLLNANIQDKEIRKQHNQGVRNFLK